MVLHQSIPHVHHQHEDSHSHSDLAHSEGHHHHDDSSQENEDSSYDFFGFFMDMHVHSTVSSDIAILKRKTVEQQTIVDKDVANNDFGFQGPFLIDNRENDKWPMCTQPKWNSTPYLSHLVLRGPPSLG